MLRSSFSSLHPIRCKVCIRERKMEKSGGVGTLITSHGDLDRCFFPSSGLWNRRIEPAISIRGSASDKTFREDAATNIMKDDMLGKVRYVD